MRTSSALYQRPIYMEYRNAADQYMYTLYKRMSATGGDSLSRADVTRNVAVNGWRKPSAYSAEAYSGALWSGRLKVKYPVQGDYRVYDAQSVEYEFGWIPSPEMNVAAGLIARAEQKLIGKIKGETLQLANDVLEASQVKNLAASARDKPMQTLKGAVAVLQRVASAYNAVKHGRYKQAARILDIKPRRSRGKGVSSQWLEYRYGWLPLLSSIYDAYELARKGIDVRYAFEAQVVQKLDPSYQWTNSGLPGAVTIDCKQKGSYIVKCRVDYKVDDAEVRRLAAIGMADPATIAWEAVPFSFVVDWFMPLTNVIGAVGASRGLKFVSGTRTTVARVTRTASARLSGPKGTGRYAVECSGRASASWFKMNRTLYTSTPIPGVYMRNPFSVTHLLDAIALIRQLVK